MNDNSKTSLVSSKSQLDTTTVGFASVTAMQMSSFSVSSSKARACFVMLFVNALLITGIFISASRRSKVVSPPHKTNTTNVPNPQETPTERTRVQSYIKMRKIPADIQNALMKVHRYLESQTEVNATGGCQFTWKFNSKDNSVDVFICE